MVLGMLRMAPQVSLPHSLTKSLLVAGEGSVFEGSLRRRALTAGSNYSGGGGKEYQPTAVINLYKSGEGGDAPVGGWLGHGVGGVKRWAQVRRVGSQNALLFGGGS